MTKVTAFVFLMLLVSGCSKKHKPFETVDDSGVLDNLESQASQFLEAREKGLFAQYVALMHPAFIEMSGGKEQYVKRITTASEGKSENRVDTFQLTGISQIVKEDTTLAAYVSTEVRLTYKAKSYYILAKPFHIASSIDNGVTWRFVPRGNMDKDTEAFDELHFPVLRKHVPMPEFSWQTIEEASDTR